MRRGYSLIELMISVALLGIASAALVQQGTQHERAALRAMAIEGLVRVLDQELERARACDSRRCLEALATATATTTGVDGAASSWARAHVFREVTGGPSETVRVEIRASIPDVARERRVTALFWVAE